MTNINFWKVTGKNYLSQYKKADYKLYNRTCCFCSVQIFRNIWKHIYMNILIWKRKIKNSLFCLKNEFIMYLFAKKKKLMFCNRWKFNSIERNYIFFHEWSELSCRLIPADAELSHVFSIFNCRKNLEATFIFKCKRN